MAATVPRWRSAAVAWGRAAVGRRGGGWRGRRARASLVVLSDRLDQVLGQALGHLHALLVRAWFGFGFGFGLGLGLGFGFGFGFAFGFGLGLGLGLLTLTQPPN